MVDPGLALGAISLAGGLIGGIGKKRPNVKNINRRWLGYKPQYQLTAEDEAFGARRLGRANEVISRAAQFGSENVARRYRARGLGGPAEDQALNDVAQGAQVQRREASGDVSDLLDRIRQRGLDFERQKGMMAWNAELDQAFGDMNRADSQSAMWWNSQLELLPMLLNVGKPQQQDTAGGGGGSNPSAPRRPQPMPSY